MPGYPDERKEREMRVLEGSTDGTASEEKLLTENR